jgi:enoyl-CoA hydratase
MIALEMIQYATSNHCAEITLNRPKALNALNRQVLEELHVVLKNLASSTDIHAVLITGSGDKAFVAGADIASMASMSEQEALAFAALGHEVMHALETLPMPTFACVNGFALGGGCELLLACDVAVASEKARFGLPEVTLGLIPGFGGTARLPYKIGVGAACEWIFSGQVYNAQEALRVGLVQKVVPHETCLQETRALAHTVVSRSPLAVRTAKAVLLAQRAQAVAQACAHEQKTFAHLFTSHDAHEGMAAFVEKRTPHFTGA